LPTSLAELLNHKEARRLLSDEHFSVTQVTAWASMKSFRAKDGSDEPPSGGRNGERRYTIGDSPTATSSSALLPFNWIEKYAGAESFCAEQ
jgi:hypothetical protein